MRRLIIACVIGIAGGGCAGDLGSVALRPNWRRWKPQPPAVTPDRVEMHYIFLDLPAEDSLVGRSLWEQADEQAIPMELQTQLRRNGLRLGKLGSRLPEELLELLESQPTGQGRLHSAPAGSVVKIQTTDQPQKWDLFTLDQGRPRGEEIPDAQGYLRLSASLAGEAGVLLSIVPEVAFGQTTNRPVPAPDLSGWQLRTERPLRSFPHLKADMELQSGQYLLIGAWHDQPGSLGNQCFSSQQQGKEMHRLLLVRVVRPSRDELFAAGYDLDDFFPSTPRPRSAAPGRSLVKEAVLTSRGS